MTRKEEIRQKAVEIQCDHYDGYYSGHIESYQQAAIDGAEWADRTMIERVCLWLGENARDYVTYEDSMVMPSMRANINVDGLITDLKKAMED